MLFSTILWSSMDMQTRTQVMMGTIVDITLPSKVETHIDHSFDIIRDMEHILSSYSPKAYLHRLNHQKSLPTHPILVDIIKESIGYYTLTQGYFDITIGSITKELYHFGEEVASPSSLELNSAKLDIKGINLGVETIRLDENITLDLGGIGKGYAVDKVVSYLKEQNITRGRIALSGDIACLDKCDIYIQSPLGERVFAKVSTLSAYISISTSGTYRRYAKEKSQHHLIDPKQRKPQQNFISISLFAYGDNSRLDALTTAISVMPKALALSFLANHNELSYILVESNGTILFGDRKNIIDIVWLDYNETPNIQSNTKDSNIYNRSETNLIHPNTSNPINIKR